MKSLGELRCARGGHADPGDGICACGEFYYLDEEDEPRGTFAMVQCPMCSDWISVPVSVRAVRPLDGPTTLTIDGSPAFDHRCSL